MIKNYITRDCSRSLNIPPFLLNLHLKLTENVNKAPTTLEEFKVLYKATAFMVHILTTVPLKTHSKLRGQVKKVLWSDETESGARCYV